MAPELTIASSTADTDTSYTAAGASIVSLACARHLPCHRELNNDTSSCPETPFKSTNSHVDTPPASLIQVLTADRTSPHGSHLPARYHRPLMWENSLSHAP